MPAPPRLKPSMPSRAHLTSAAATRCLHAPPRRISRRCSRPALWRYFGRCCLTTCRGECSASVPDPLHPLHPLGSKGGPRRVHPEPPQARPAHRMYNDASMQRRCLILAAAAAAAQHPAVRGACAWPVGQLQRRLGGSGRAERDPAAAGEPGRPPRGAARPAMGRAGSGRQAEASGRLRAWHGA
eukprot:366558-Chlamydomonas_euryale.AAC.8